jgi:hypothetical protein
MQRENAERLAALMREARGSRSFREMERLSRDEDGSPGIGATTWKRYEDPDAMTGVRPNANKLLGVARAIGAEPEEVFSAAGQPTPRTPVRRQATASEEIPAALAGIWSELEPQERERVLGYAAALWEAREHRA